MILCVTPNPALDRTLTVPGFRMHEVSRATRVMQAAGGKGMNVARVTRLLGGEAICAGLLGGHTGRLLAQLAAAEDLIGHWTWIEEETRIATAVADESGRDATLINEPGPVVSDAQWQQFAESVAQVAQNAQAVTFCGSVPIGPAPAQFAGMLSACAGQGIPVWADTSGEWLRVATGVRGVNIKVNGDEIAVLAGRAVAGVQDAARAARALQHERGLTRVVITLGKHGAAMAGTTGAWIATPPRVHAVSTIGSGDAFLAGLVNALNLGADEPDALRCAIAAGSANAISVGAGRFDLADYRDALAQVRPVQVV
jgi:1-phosphofructokinase family hexose kinase